MADTNGHANGHANGTPYVVPILINGKEETLSSTFDVTSPDTGKLLWQSSSASKEDVARAIEAAQAAFTSWSKSKPTQRRDIFLKAAELLESRTEEYARYMQLETGALPAFSTYFNLPVSVGLLRDVAGRITTVTGSVPVCGDDGRSAMVLKEPFGVVLGIAPWNAPFILGFRAVIYALAAGNTTILKAPELSPRCYWAIGQVFKDAGLPDGCLNVVVCKPADAPAITKSIIEHPYVKKVNFTGSTFVGRIIAEIAGKNLKPCLMELGGKNSAIILEDANLENAAKECAVGSFLHSGQICMSTDRILVHRSVSDKFKEQFYKAIATIFPDSEPPALLVTPAGYKKTAGIASSTVQAGAKLAYGSLDTQDASNTRMRPVVIDGIQKGMDLYSEEAFGPAVGIMEIDSEQQAIDVINDTGYGLAAAVFTEDLKAGFRVAKEIQSGAVHINGMTIHDEPNLPHGGVGESGWGRFNATNGIEEFLRTKTITWKD